MSLFNMVFGKGQTKNINNLNQEVNNVSEIDNPNNYNQIESVETDSSIQPDEISEYDQMIGNVSSQYGTTPENLEDIMNRIAYHETGPSQRMNPKAIQRVGIGTNIDGTTEIGEGVGRGLFQFETGQDQGGATAMNRLQRYYEQNQMEVPSWTQYDSSKGVDASQLTPEQQKMMFLANTTLGKGRSFEGVDSDNLANWWNEFHYAGPENKMGLFNESMNAYDINNKPSIEEQAFTGY